MKAIATVLALGIIVIVVLLAAGAAVLLMMMPSPVQSENTTQVVAMASATSLGNILTGTNGMTLYMFAPDTNGQSVCYGACAVYWPPLTVASGTTPLGQGITANLGVTKRTDGTTQVTANGLPLYYYKGDSAPGDTKGQAVNASGGYWYVVSPSGQAIVPNSPQPNVSQSTITITNAPQSVDIDQPFNVSWSLNGPAGTTPHTAVHFGLASVTNPQGPSDYPDASTFLCTVSPCSIPANFTVAMAINESGTYHYRAHAVIGGANVWSDERTITVADIYALSISSFAFSPQNWTIERGDTANWTNYDSVAHTVSSTNNGTELNSGTLQKGQSYLHTFNTLGTFHYFCAIHPHMQGTVTVIQQGCTDSCQNHSYSCGSFTICGTVQNCGSCPSGMDCTYGQCVVPLSGGGGY